MADSIRLRWLKATDTDLGEIAASLNLKDWDPSADEYTEASLKGFLADERHFYLLGYVGDEIAGAAHAYLMLHPGGMHYLYIDEVDTREGFRRLGVASEMMRALIQLSRDKGADEAWLGTEDDNEAAKGLYESLGPDEVEHGPLYMFKNKK